MSDLIADLKHAARRLRRAPAFTVTAVLTLALGVAATTAFYAIADAIVGRPVSATALADIYGVRLWPAPGTPGGDLPISLAAARAIEATPPSPVVAAAAMFQSNPADLAMPGRIERVTLQGVTPGYRAVFDLAPSRGRWVEPNDDRPGAPRRVAVISEHLWRSVFGSDESTIGTGRIRLRPQVVRPGASTEPFTIVGVGPAGYRGPWGRAAGGAGAVDVWIPSGALIDIDNFARTAAERFGVGLLVRLQPGSPTTPASIRLPAVAAAAAGQVGTPVGASLTPASRIFSPPSQWTRSALAVVALSLLVLLAASANLANMMLARGLHRTGEMSLRLSLGANRWRIARLLMAEALLIALLAAAAGLAIALGAVRLFANSVPSLPFVHGQRLQLPDVSPSPAVFGVAFASGVIAALVVGALTAWRSSRVPAVVAMAATGSAIGLTRRTRGLRTMMVAVQVTAALVLVMVCGLYLETTVLRLAREHLIGRSVQYDHARVVAASVDLAKHEFTAARGRHFFSRVVPQVAAVSGVERVALADSLPGAMGALAPREMFLEIEAPGRGLAGTLRRGVARFSRVSPGFLAATGIPLLRGRDFVETDAEGAALVALVSRSAAETMWPGEEAVGRRLRFDHRYLTVVGVTGDPIGGRERWGFDVDRWSNHVLVPAAQHYRAAMAVIVRSEAPLGRVDAVRAAVAAVDPDVAVLEAATVDSTVLAWWAPARAALLLVGGLATAALGIAMLGVYGVLQFFVSTRTREFGIRTALGASRRQVLRLVLDEAVHIVLVGLLVGVFVAAVGSRFVQYRQFDIMPNSITNWVAVPLLILASGLIAAWLPARRAARVDPNVALRDL